MCAIIADSLMSISNEMCGGFLVHTMKHCCIRKCYPLHMRKHVTVALSEECMLHSYAIAKHYVYHALGLDAILCVYLVCLTREQAWHSDGIIQREEFQTPPKPSFAPSDKVTYSLNLP